MQNFIRIISLVFCFSLISGCYFCPTFKPDVTQGNVIKREMADQIQVGMTAEQVFSIMGAPILENTFSQNRLHYVYYFERSGRVIVKKRLILYFDRGRVVKIDRCIPEVKNVYPLY